jgi:chemotaxis protein methyltransferase CheR
MAVDPSSPQILSGLISDTDFLRFRDFFYRKTGIFFENGKRYFVDKRLLQRMEATGHAQFRSYFSLIRFQASQEELQTLINLMTVNETYFFREDYQFQCMVNSILNEILRHHKKQLLRIWSMPCSSGEEAYSIALYLLEYWDQINHIDVELVASDIDSQILKAAQRGIYSRRAVQYLPDTLLKRHFTVLAEQQFQVSDDLRESIHFTQVNLTDTEQTRRYRGFDLIFCRNLLIYFDDASRRQAIEALFDALNPGGFIFLGHSESMSRISSLFQVRKFPDAIAYQRPLTTKKGDL